MPSGLARRFGSVAVSANGGSIILRWRISWTPRPLHPNPRLRDNDRNLTTSRDPDAYDLVDRPLQQSHARLLSPVGSAPWVAAEMTNGGPRVHTPAWHTVFVGAQDIRRLALGGGAGDDDARDVLALAGAHVVDDRDLAVGEFDGVADHGRPFQADHEAHLARVFIGVDDPEGQHEGKATGAAEPVR